MKQQVYTGTATWRKGFSALLFCAGACAADAQAFSINYTFSGISSTQESYFIAAKNFWESAITGYRPGVALAAVSVNASAIAIDGLNEILGQAGPVASTVVSGFTYVTQGVMQFDIPDIQPMIDAGVFGEVVRHEMAHVLGFGTLWEKNGLFNSAVPGRYTGAYALQTYRAEFNRPFDSWVPVETTGGPGTAESHWAESNFGLNPTGVVDAAGRDFRGELMTGWLNSPAFVSQTTVASFQDLGYSVNLSAVPEVGPAAMLLMGLPLVAAIASARRRYPTALPTAAGANTPMA